MQNKRKPKVADSEIRRRLIEQGLLKVRDDAFQESSAEKKDRRAGTPGQGKARHGGQVGKGDAKGEKASRAKAPETCGKRAPEPGTIVH